MAVRKYIYDGDAVLQETDGAGNVLTEYTRTGGGYGDLLSAYDGTSAKYFEPDGLGSTDALADQSQAVVDRWSYRAFGIATQTAGTDSTPFTWVGRQGYFSDSETGLYLLGNGTRYYDPAVAQFLSRDPMGFGSEESNLRRYTANRPVTLTDPSGFAPAGGISPTCNVTSFTIFGVVPCGYHKQLADLADFVGSSFRIAATFSEPCHCCEYRQYVKGTIKSSGEVGQFFRGDWTEDETPDGDAYGHRDSENDPDDDYFAPSDPVCQSGYLKRFFGCKYVMLDTPGWRDAPAQARKLGKELTISIDLLFNVKIIDTCNGDRSVIENLIPVKCTVKFDKNGKVIN